MATSKKLVMDRRTALAAFGALGGGAFRFACTGSTEATVDALTPDVGAAADAGVDGAAAACAAIPDETAGPYPDTMNMVGNAATYRSNIIEDRVGIPLTVTITVVDSANGCAPIAGANVEVWHCDAGGIYSEYANSMNAGSTTTTFLRGVHTTDASGVVTFETIYPGWYQGRATHIHIEVFDGTTSKKTTQLGFPETVSSTIYGGGSSLYTKGLNPTTNAADMVFGDGDSLEIAQTAGTIAAGYTAALQVGIASF
jgi:protocatechuate 3,4-dioxygenase beta subunit